MKYFDQIKKNACICIIGASLFTGSAFAQGYYAYGASVKVDGSDNFASVWQAEDPTTGNYEVQGVYGNGNVGVTPTAITDPTLINAQNPILASSLLSTATTRACCAWLATDLTSGYNYIQASTATSSGWSTTPQLLSLNDGSEYPNNDQVISMSPDGLVIFVTWSSYLPNIGSTVIRAAYSTNGGTTWNTAVSLSSL